MDGEGGGSSNGTPTFNPTTPWGNESEQNEVSRMSFKETPNLMADIKGTGSFIKSIPAVAVAYAVIKTAYTITKTAAEFNAIETGDFSATNAFNNYESVKNAIFHPISTTIQTVRQRRMDRVENQRREMQRQLLGDSEINRYTNRGY